jgi:hypothetical protein
MEREVEMLPNGKHISTFAYILTFSKVFSWRFLWIFQLLYQNRVHQF